VASVSVCLSLCLYSRISPDQHVRSSPIFCACYLWPYLGPPLAASRHTSGFIDDVINKQLIVKNGSQSVRHLTAIGLVMPNLLISYCSVTASTTVHLPNHTVNLPVHPCSLIRFMHVILY